MDGVSRGSNKNSKSFNNDFSFVSGENNIFLNSIELSFSKY